MNPRIELYPDRSGKAARAFIRSIGGDPDRVKFVEVGR